MPLLLLFVLTAGAQKPSTPADRVPVYCVAAPERSGLTEIPVRDREDSTSDLVKALAGSKEVVTVPAADQAAIVVVIVDRMTERTSQPVYDKSGRHYTDVHRYVVKARLRVGTYETPLEGVTNGNWRLAASALGGAIEKWVRQNRAMVSAASAPRPAAGATSPRQAAMTWLLSELDDAPSHIVAPGRTQIDAFREKVRDQPALAATLALVVAPAATFRKQGKKVSAAGQTVALGTELSITFEPEAIAGDHALVPLSVKAGGQVARGAIELTREAGAWRVAATDLGPQARWPRFDSPAFMSELADRVSAARPPR
jgi:hypothetical protein